MKKIFAIFFLAAAVFTSCGGGNKAPKDNASDKKEGVKIQFNVDTYDLGLIDHDTLLNCHFIYHNIGKQNAVIDHVDKHCGCTLPAYFQSVLAPGDSASMTVALETRALETGYFNKSVEVYFSGSDEPIKLTLKGEFVRRR